MEGRRRKSNYIDLGRGSLCWVEKQKVVRPYWICLAPLRSTFSSVAQSCPTLCNPMNRSTPDLPVHHHLPEFTQSHVHRVRDAIQPSHPQSSPSPPAPNPSQHQSLFQWVALIVNKRVRNAVLGCNLKNNRIISVCFQETIQYHSNPSLCPN